VLAKNLDAKKYHITVISPRTYFVFTPLLTDSAVGTLEFRNILESVRRAKGRTTDVEYIQAWADDVDFANKTVDVEPAVLDPKQSYALTQAQDVPESKLPPEEGAPKGIRLKDRVPVFPVRYDKLLVTVGSYSQTFNTPGVRENAFFLKDVGDARQIRKRILECFELCHMPSVPDQIKSQLLHFVVVGGGPTGIEFAGNLSDLLNQDLAKMHPGLMKHVKITVYDVAPKVLPMFDAALSDYAISQYSRKNIDIRTSHHVEELRRGPPETHETQGSPVPPEQIFTIRTKEDGELGTGMCVWSTGLMNNPFVAKALDHVRKFPTESAKVLEGNAPTSERWQIKRSPKTGGIIVDNHFRVQLQTQGQSEPKGRAVMQDVFALGDCTMLDSIDPPLPATAQVANQEARYLAKQFNKHFDPTRGQFDAESYSQGAGFDFHSRGVMTFLGGSKAILQGPETETQGAGKKLKGFLAYLIWRGAYLTMTLSWRNKVLIPVQWLTVRIFGRSVSRF
jgi:NADH dehydrogenase FAD-containing subunit